MILYIDETEDIDYFIVAGLLVNDEKYIEEAYKHFKNKISNYKINDKAKEKLYREFKSIILDRHYQKIKKMMLREINSINNHYIIYSIKIKKDVKLKQKLKEKIYIELIIKIVSSINNDVSIIYDRFGNNNFENTITNELLKLNNVINADPKDSQLVHGLQFVDNLCSVIRMYVSNKDDNKYYEIIKDNIKIIM